MHNCRTNVYSIAQQPQCSFNFHTRGGRTLRAGVARPKCAPNNTEISPTYSQNHCPNTYSFRHPAPGPVVAGITSNDTLYTPQDLDNRPLDHMKTVVEEVVTSWTAGTAESPAQEAQIAKTLRSLMDNGGFAAVKIIGYEHNWSDAGAYPVEL
ncbi:hypothetical protein C2E23DRAFT_895152, partial [Lenzites betulinus]